MYSDVLYLHDETPSKITW